MPDLREQLRDYVEANIERVDADDVRAAVPHPTAQTLPSHSRLKPTWAFVLGAVFVLAVGGIAMLLRGDPSVVDEVSSPSGSVDGWSPLLSTAKANKAPPAATCPDDASSDLMGPHDQVRPWGAQWSNQAAAFDTRMGRIMFFDEKGGTWTFDVCTNTWEEMNPEYRQENGQTWPEDPDGWLGQLVYDVDSDRTIAFRGDSLAVYDAEANTWTLRSQPPRYETGIPGSGAVYHPDSGLIVTQTWEAGLVAYDVDTDTWTPIGTLERTGQVPPYLVGYQPETGQFVFVGGFDDRGMLVDAQTGDTVDFLTPDVFARFGQLGFATSTDGVFVEFDDGFCRLDALATAWDCRDFWYEETGESAGLLAAIVDDPVNNRVVLIYGYGDGWDGQRFHEVNDIWAVDFTTGEWTHLLDRTGEIRWEGDEP